MSGPAVGVLALPAGGVRASARGKTCCGSSILLAFNGSNMRPRSSWPYSVPTPTASTKILDRFDPALLAPRRSRRR